MPGFDAYHKWLGIQPEEQPVNHYRLLGINLFESDPDVITNAADQRMGHVRAFQMGEHAAWSQRILNELAMARVCLLNASRKSQYDGQLQRQMAVSPQHDGQVQHLTPVSPQYDGQVQHPTPVSSQLAWQLQRQMPVPPQYDWTIVQKKEAGSCPHTSHRNLRRCSHQLSWSRAAFPIWALPPRTSNARNTSGEHHRLRLRCLLVSLAC